MEALVSLVVALIGLVAIAVAIVVARSGRPRDAGAAAQRAVTPDATRASLERLQRSVSDLQRATAESVNALRADVQRSLGTTEQQVLTQTGATQRSLADLSRQLGTLAEQSARIGDLAKDVGSLHDLLRAPKPRGGFGELLLERVLADCLPADAFELQYTYRDGSRVDAVVKFAGRLVPIDAKFPVESF
ncbi:MAG: DNA recombination protein RmuC, partial [Chloroflexota bacterium]